MVLAHVSPGDPHAVAHNAERDEINAINARSSAPRSSLKGYFPIHKALLAGNCTILAMGDSKTEGTGIPNATDRWMNKLQNILRAQYSSADLGKGYIPAKYATFYDFGDKPVISGTVYDVRTTGLGRRSILMSAGATVTFGAMTFNSTPLKVHWTQITGGGDLEILTDGLVRATIATVGTGGSKVTNVTIPAGVRTVVVRCKDGGAAAQFEGIFNSTSTSGVKVIDGSISGGTFAYFGSDAPTNGHWTAADVYAPQGAIMAFGANDMSSENPNQVVADAVVTVNKFFNLVPTGGLVILFGTERTETPESGTVRKYEDALKAEFSEDSRISILHESDLWMPKVGVDYTWGGDDGWLADTVHTSAAAHTEIAEYLAEPVRSFNKVINHASQHANGGDDPISPASIGAATQVSLNTVSGIANSADAMAKAHKARHAIGGADALTPADIGAVEASRFLTGTAPPEGVIAAPVGTTYTDTNATFGAVEWTKWTGTGTTGWRVTKGDTGWRNITSTITWKSHVTPYAWWIRRVNGRVELSFDFLTNDSVTSLCDTPAAILVPIGFRFVNYSTTLQRFLVGDGGNNTNTLFLNAAGSSGTSLLLDVAPGTVSRRWRGNGSWVTDQAWPTVLPGTPA